jgi:hypothetical protein
MKNKLSIETFAKHVSEKGLASKIYEENFQTALRQSNFLKI